MTFLVVALPLVVILVLVYPVLLLVCPLVVVLVIPGVVSAFPVVILLVLSVGLLMIDSNICEQKTLYCA